MRQALADRVVLPTADAEPSETVRRMRAMFAHD